MIAGFKPRNHPQQVQRRGSIDDVDDRRSPPATFWKLDREFGFTIDAAASVADNALKQRWAGERVWCNPPYSNLGCWTRKAHEERAALVVMLLPSNRTEQPWWQSWVEPHRDRGGRLSTRFLPGRLNFATPANPMGKYNSSPTFGSVVLIWTAQETAHAR